MRRKIPKNRVVWFRHPKLTRFTYARQRMGKSPYVTRPHRFRHLH